MTKEAFALGFAIIACMPMSAHVHGTQSMDECIFAFTPIEFLEWLASVQQLSVGFDEPVDDWVTSADLKALQDLLSSDKPCASVSLTRSSFLSAKPSTIGTEALFMLNGYLKRRYPPGLHSMSNTLPQKEEIQAALAAESLLQMRDRFIDRIPFVRVYLVVEGGERSVVLEEGAQDLESLLNREKARLGDAAIQSVTIARDENKRVWRFARSGPCAASDKVLRRFSLQEGDRVRLSLEP